MCLCLFTAAMSKYVGPVLAIISSSRTLQAAFTPRSRGVHGTFTDLNDHEHAFVIKTERGR